MRRIKFIFVSYIFIFKFHLSREFKVKSQRTKEGYANNWDIVLVKRGLNVAFQDEERSEEHCNKL